MILEQPAPKCLVCFDRTGYLLCFVGKDFTAILFHQHCTWNSDISIACCDYQASWL